MAKPRPVRAELPSRRAPVQIRGQRTLATLLEAAAQVVLKDGEAGFTTNHIAERAGVSIGTLYQYFPDKAAILDHLVLDWRTRAIAQIDLALIEALAGPAPPDQVVRAAVRAVLHAFGGGAPAVRPLARLAWRHETNNQIGRAMRLAAERLGLRLQPWAAATGAVISLEQVYIATRAVLGAIRFASMEDSPLLDSPAFEDGLTRLALAVMLPADNPPP